MEQEDIINQIFKTVDAKKVIVNKWKKENKNTLVDNKGGIYFLTDDNDKYLYVGMTSNASTSNLFQRLYGNGNAAHVKKTWFEEVKKVYFYKMKSGIEKGSIIIVERIMIKKLIPKYNDLYYDDEDLETAQKELY